MVGEAFGCGLASYTKTSSDVIGAPIVRNYIECFYGIFNERSASLGINIDLDILEPTLVQFQERVKQLQQDIRDAGGDWVGTLMSQSPIYFLLNKENFFTLLHHLGQPIDKTTIPGLQELGLITFDSPKKTWSHGE